MVREDRSRVNSNEQKLFCSPFQGRTFFNFPKKEMDPATHPRTQDRIRILFE